MQLSFFFLITNSENIINKQGDYKSHPEVGQLSTIYRKHPEKKKKRNQVLGDFCTLLDRPSPGSTAPSRRRRRQATSRPQEGRRTETLEDEASLRSPHHPPDEAAGI
jgi:hypothetical protein